MFTSINNIIQGRKVNLSLKLFVLIVAAVLISAIDLEGVYKSTRDVLINIFVSLMVVQYFIETKSKIENSDEIDSFFTNICKQHSAIRKNILSKLESTKTNQNKNNYMHIETGRFVKLINLQEDSYSKVLNAESRNQIHLYKSQLAIVFKKGRSEEKLVAKLKSSNELITKLVNDNCTKKRAKELVDDYLWTEEEIKYLASQVIQLKHLRAFSEHAGLSKNQIQEDRKLSVTVIEPELEDA